MKCRRCQSSFRYSRSVAFSPMGSRPLVSPKRSSTLGSLARCVVSISRKKRSSSSERIRRTLLGAGVPDFVTVCIILVHEDELPCLLILIRLAGLTEGSRSGTFIETTRRALPNVITERYCVLKSGTQQLVRPSSPRFNWPHPC